MVKQKSSPFAWYIYQIPDFDFVFFFLFMILNSYANKIKKEAVLNNQIKRNPSVPFPALLLLSRLLKVRGQWLQMYGFSPWNLRSENLRSEVASPALDSELADGSRERDLGLSGGFSRVTLRRDWRLALAPDPALADLLDPSSFSAGFRIAVGKAFESDFFATILAAGMSFVSSLLLTLELRPFSSFLRFFSGNPRFLFSSGKPSLTIFSVESKARFLSRNSTGLLSIFSIVLMDLTGVGVRMTTWSRGEMAGDMFKRFRLITGL